MHMVGDSPNNFRHTINGSHHASEICVKTFAPVGGDDWFVVFSSKNKMVMEAEVGDDMGVDSLSGGPPGTQRISISGKPGVVTPG